MASEHVAPEHEGLGTVCRVRPGTVLMTEGTPGRQAFLILAGAARVVVGGRLVGHLGHGEFVGEMAPVNNGPSSATVVADSAMSVVVFDAPAFAALLADPAVDRALRETLVARLRSSNNTRQQENEQ